MFYSKLIILLQLVSYELSLVYRFVTFIALLPSNYVNYTSGLIVDGT
jgi:hypothetical protein